MIYYHTGDTVEGVICYYMCDKVEGVIICHHTGDTVEGVIICYHTCYTGVVVSHLLAYELVHGEVEMLAPRYRCFGPSFFFFLVSDAG